MLPSIVEYLHDELDGVSDLMSPVQPLLTQAVTDDDHSKRNGKNNNYNRFKFIIFLGFHINRTTHNRDSLPSSTNTQQC